MTARASRAAAVASAPAKVILLGEHGVNRDQPALAAAVGARATCRAELLDEPRYRIVSSIGCREAAVTELDALVAEVEELSARLDHDGICKLADADRLAPVAFALGLLRRRLAFTGANVELESGIPIGAGLGSGAAVVCALAAASAEASSLALDDSEIAEIGRAGDTIAHGGIASGLDSSASALGGVVRYSLAEGTRRVPVGSSLRLVVADTGTTARTSTVNARVRAVVDADPGKASVFVAIGALVDAAEAALVAGRLEEFGALMNENQELLRGIDVSSPQSTGWSMRHARPALWERSFRAPAAAAS